MPFVVEDSPAFAARCVQEFLALVVAHGIDGDTGGVCEFLDEILHARKVTQR